MKAEYIPNSGYGRYFLQAKEEKEHQEMQVFLEGSHHIDLMLYIDTSGLTSQGKIIERHFTISYRKITIKYLLREIWRLIWK